MIKVYRCVSEISFNLKTDGHKRRINFEPVTGGRGQFRTSEHKMQKEIEKLDQFGSVIRVAGTIEEDGDDEDRDGPKVDSPLNVIEKGHGEEMGEELSDGEEGEKVLNEGGFDGEKDIQEGVTSFAEAREYLITKGCEKAVRNEENILIYTQELSVELLNLK